MDARTLLHILEDLTRLPCAPFHENAVIGYVERFAERRGIASRRDPYGNVLLSLDPGGAGGRALVLHAHMDHPGFEITGREGDLYRARWMGGVAEEYFPDAEVEVFSDPPVPGRIVDYRKDEQGQVNEVILEMYDDVPEAAYGSWALEPWRVTPPVVNLRAADDLAGVAAVLAAIEVIWARQDPVRVIGAFTRAEEVGFLGAIGLTRGRLLPESAAVITVECSGELPHVQLGRGPVVRVGDRTGVFDLQLVHFLSETAHTIAERYDDFAWQRALMDRGTCESTVFALNGHAAACLAFPVLNYHNSGGDGYSVRSEQVHLNDFFGGVTLLTEAARRWPDEGQGVSERLLEQVLASAKPGMVRLANDPLSG